MIVSLARRASRSDGMKSTKTFRQRITLIDEPVVPRMGLLSQQAHAVVMRVSLRHYLVENMVVSFDFQLESDAGFLQEVSLDVCRRDFQTRTEVNTDEFPLKRIEMQNCLSPF